jgi:hypothetical protein
MLHAGRLTTAGGEDWHAARIDCSQLAARQAKKNIGALLVVEGGRIIGISSERDDVRKVLAMDFTPRGTPLRDIRKRSGQALLKIKRAAVQALC